MSLHACHVSSLGIFFWGGWREVGIACGQLVWPVEPCLCFSILESVWYLAAALFPCLGRISCIRQLISWTAFLLCDAVQQILPLSYTRVALAELQCSAKWYIPKWQFTVMAFLLVYDPLCQTTAMKCNCQWWYCGHCHAMYLISLLLYCCLFPSLPFRSSLTLKFGCNLLNKSLVVQVCTEKRSDSYRSPVVGLETWAKFNHFLSSVTKTMQTVDAAEDEEEERLVREEWEHRCFLQAFCFFLCLIELL